MPTCSQSLVSQPGRWARRLCCACLILSSCSLTLAGNALADTGLPTTVFEFSDDVPAGFESLATEQTTFVDIRFNGKIVGSSSVTGDDERIRFDAPVTVTALLDGLRDPQAVQALLGETLPTNAGRLCYSRADPPGCGTVEPNPIALIFDQQNLLVDVFLSPEFQQIQSRMDRQYLAPAPPRASSILSMDAVASALQDESAVINLSGKILAGYGPGFFSSEADYNSHTERKRLRSLTLTHQLRDHEMRLGSYSFQPGGALNGFDLLGASVASSLHTRLDLEQAFSSELIVFLPRRALVQLAVDDRVYAATSYQAGNQALDTKALPDGSYELEIRIADPLTGNRTERRQFTKSARMPPRGQTIYSATAGVPLYFNENHVFPDRVPIGILAASASRRILGHSAVTLGLSKLGSVALLQSEYIFLGPQISLQLTGSLGSHNTHATAVRGSWTRGRFNANVTGEWFKSDVRPSVSSGEFELFPENYRQISASIGRSVRRLSLNLRSRMRQEDSAQGSRSSRNISLTLRRPLLIRRNLRGNVQAGIQRNDTENRFSLDLSFTFGHSPELSSTLSGSTDQTSKDGSNQSLSLDTKWTARKADSKRWQTGLQLSTSETGENASLDTSIDHRRFLASFDTQWSRQFDEDAVLSSVARFSTQLAIDSQGGTMGGSNRVRSGLILDVVGNPSQATYDIVINGAKQGIGKIGSTRLINLQPYREYTLQLLPRAMLASTLSQNTFIFTLYPGMLERVAVEARQRILLVGTLVDGDGQLIQNAYIDQQPSPLLITSGGFVQIEATPGERIRVNRPTEASCQFRVPEVSAGEEVLVAPEPLLCLVDP